MRNLVVGAPTRWHVSQTLTLTMATLDSSWVVCNPYSIATAAISMVDCGTHHFPELLIPRGRGVRSLFETYLRRSM